SRTKFFVFTRNRIKCPFQTFDYWHKISPSIYVFQFIITVITIFAYDDGIKLLVIEGLIAVVSLVLTAFGLGYTIGNKSQK
ncbi:MAG: hypothetical protein ACI4EP_01335, partial [Suilimivivens sp.]